MQKPRQIDLGSTGFTLIELLVVVAIITLLVGICLPSLSLAKALADQATCMTRVRSQLTAVQMYAAEENGAIPVGPDEAVPFFGMAGPAMNTFATNQLWVGSLRTYNAHGALLEKHLAEARAFFCPDDDSADPEEELDHIRRRTETDAYCSYLYRQLDGRRPGPASRQLSRLGVNARGQRVSALLLDVNNEMPIPGAPTRTNHGGRKVTVGFVAGHALAFDTPNGELSLRASDDPMAFDRRLDEIFEHTDELGQ